MASSLICTCSFTILFICTLGFYFWTKKLSWTFWSQFCGCLIKRLTRFCSLMEVSINSNKLIFLWLLVFLLAKVNSWYFKAYLIRSKWKFLKNLKIHPSCCNYYCFTAEISISLRQQILINNKTYHFLR